MSQTHFISEKNGFMVVSFVGPWSRQRQEQLELCLEEVISRSERKRIVLNFHDVETIELGLIPLLAKLQMAIRAKGSALRLCFLRHEVQKLLAHHGVIRPQEVLPNLVDALKSFASVSAPSQGS